MPTRDAEALAKGIKSVIQHITDYDPNKIRNYILYNYSYSVVKKKFSELYEELMDGK